MGFNNVRHNINGRQPYHPKDLLKLDIYRYLNKIRCSSELEKECKWNIKLKGLMIGLVPDHIVTKRTTKRASADVGFIFIAYNLKRIMNIIGIKELIHLQSKRIANYNIKYRIKRTKSK